MVEIGFVHGRFQLFHNDHLKYILAAKNRCEMLVVGITSPNNSLLKYEGVDPHRSDVLANPFTYYERMQMIKLSLLGAGLKREEFDIVPFPIENPDTLLNYIPIKVQSFITIYDNWGEEKLRRLSELGYNVNVLWRDREKNLSSTMVRELITSGKKWDHLVPLEVYKYIIDNKLDARILSR